MTDTNYTDIDYDRNDGIYTANLVAVADTITDLRARIATLQARATAADEYMNAGVIKRMANAEAKVAALEQERDALRKDAERWRRLRKMGIWATFQTANTYSFSGIEASIDAAIANEGRPT